MPALRDLEARLQKWHRVHHPGPALADGPHKGLYEFKDENGEAWLWSPRPYRDEWRPVETVAEADQVRFLCPACFAKNGGSKGTHSVHVTFAGRNVPDEIGSVESSGKPSRWTVSGTTLDDLVLSPSILLDAGRAADQGCHWHGFVGSSGVPPGHAQ